MSNLVQNLALISFPASIETLSRDIEFEPSHVEEPLELLKATLGHVYRKYNPNWEADKEEEMLSKELVYVYYRSPSRVLKAYCSFMVTHQWGEEAVYLYEIHVSRDSRGAGVGARMLASLKQLAQRLGRVVYLSVFYENRAREWYEREGFHYVSRRLRSDHIGEMRWSPEP